MLLAQWAKRLPLMTPPNLWYQEPQTMTWLGLEKRLPSCLEDGLATTWPECMCTDAHCLPDLFP